ncbi:MAG: alpha/beta hydrolase family protein [Chryseolinea sp.]
MKQKRREFIKISGLAGITMASGINGFGMQNNFTTPVASEGAENPSGTSDQSIIGAYGPWAASLMEGKIPALSYRSPSWKSLDVWKRAAREKLRERMGIPELSGLPSVKIIKQYEFDGLHVEELTYQLPYGRPTEAVVFKPANAKGKLPGILAFHDHAGNKYLGTGKITRTAGTVPNFIKSHQDTYYEGKAWANEIAKAGYVVLVSDAFPFASRRVMLQDVPEKQRFGLTDADPENVENIKAYNEWAAKHEQIMAKSLFSAGTTWPGVFFAEDQKALDVLCARPDVDADRVGCAGLSGGGMRTVFMGGLDDRIKCAVCVGFMTTWRDLVMNKSYTHTWMTYVPILPRELDFPEILSLRAPLPTLVQNDNEDTLYTLDEMKRADSILAEVYKKANASDHYSSRYYPGPHKFDVAMQKDAFAWFDKWLKD